MVYCSLENERVVTLSVVGLFSAPGVDPDADFTQALRNPMENIPVSTAGITTTNPVSAGQGVWLWPGDLHGKDAVNIFGLVGCAAILFYDEDAGLIAAGHPVGGFINEDVINQMRAAVVDRAVEYIVYATPTFNEGTMGDYADSLAMLAENWGTRNICIIDGFGAGVGDVIADMTGNIAFG